MSKSQYNNSNSSLGAGFQFVGGAESSSAYVELSVSIKTDRDAVLYIEQSADKANWDIRSVHQYKASNGGMNFNVGSVHQWFRVIVHNTSILSQSYMRMTTYKMEEYTSSVSVGTDGEGVVRKILTDANGKLQMTFTGEIGPQGLSAYQVWLANGNEGTEEFFLESLKGSNGSNGSNGAQGVQGVQGVQGAQGVAGANGADGADGADGQNGADGEVGAAGLSAYQIWIVEGNNGTYNDFLMYLNGKSINVKGTLTSAQILALDTATLNLNDGYFSSDSFQLFVWNGVSLWVSSGSLRGPSGADGVDGVNGVNGADGVDGQDGVGITQVQADNIIVNNAKISYPDGALVAQHTTDIGTLTTAVALNTLKVGITQVQSDAIIANTAKIGLTQNVLDNVSSNNAKISYTDAALVAQHTTDLGTLTTAVALNTSKTSYEDGAVVAQHTTDLGTLTTAVALNTAKTSYEDGAVVAQHTTDLGTLTTAVALNTSKTSYEDGAVVAQHTTDIALNTAKLSYTDGALVAQHTTDIALNTAKVSYTDGALVAQHTTDIALNTAKVSYSDGALVAQHTTDIGTLTTAVALNTAKVGITTQQANDITANNAKISFSVANQNALTTATNNISTNTSAIALNTAKQGVSKPSVFYELTASGVAASVYDGSAGFVKRNITATDSDGSANFSVSAGVFTCAVAGDYYVNFTGNAKSTNKFMHKLRKTTPANEADVLFSTCGNASASGSHTSSTEAYGVVSCVVGDIFELQLRTEEATGLGGEDGGFGVSNLHAFISFSKVA